MSRIGGAPRGPWWWPFLYWMPMLESARRLGYEQAYCCVTVFFRRKAIAASKGGNEEVRQLFDMWADSFEKREWDTAKTKEDA